MKKKIFVIVLIIIVLLVVGLTVFLAYNKGNNSNGNTELEDLQDGKTLVNMVGNTVVVQSMKEDYIASTIYGFFNDKLKSVKIEMDFRFNTEALQKKYESLLLEVEKSTLYEKLELKDSIITLYCTDAMIDLTGKAENQEEFYNSMLLIYDRDLVIENEKYAFYKYNIRMVQEIVDINIAMNTTDSENSEYEKWLGIIEGYTENDINYKREPNFYLTINEIPIAIISEDLISTIGILHTDVYNGPYYISKDGKVYTAGYKYKNVVYYD